MWVVYQITNRNNGKRYVGKTCDLRQRWYDHCYSAKNDTGFYLHRAIKKHGRDSFSSKIIVVCEREVDAHKVEKLIIKVNQLRNPAIGYNIAEGGSGGNTMTQEQIDNQYAIGPNDYDRFRNLFEQGATQKQIEIEFSVSGNAVLSCAKRLGLSFKERRSKRALAVKESKKSSKKTRKITQEKKETRSEIAKRSNVHRALPPEVQEKIKTLYFIERLTAKQISEILQTSSGRVRSTISRAYRHMSVEERTVLGKNHKRSNRDGRDE